MEDLISIGEALKFITWPGAAIFTVWKIGVPLLQHFLSRRPNGVKRSIEKAVYDKVTNNHLGDIRHSIENLEKDVREVKRTIADTRDRVSRVEGKMNGFLNK